MENIRSHEVLPVNRRAKDTFFKTVYATEERQRALASFLLGVDGEKAATPDLDVVVHVYDFRMTLAETLKYIEQNLIPDRFMAFDNDLRNYAFTASGITYMQRAAKEEKQKKYIMLVNVSTVAEYLALLIERNIFVDLLTDKEVCDMTMAQFSRDDMLIYQGREEGRKEGREEGRAEGKAESIIDLLNDLGELPDSLENLIMEQTDAQTLQKWLKFAARAGSIEEFEESIGLISLER